MLTIATVVKDDPLGLVETCHSIDAQVMPDRVEHLVIDGSISRVSSADIDSSSVVDRRVEWQKPQGIYPAMNRALDDARGEYIWFMNAGDTLADSSTITQVQTFIESNPDWIVGRVLVRDRAGGEHASHSWDFATEQKHFFARGKFPPHQATIVRSSLLRELGGFDTRYRIAADYHAALRLSRISVPLMTDEVLACFSEGGVSTWRWRQAHREFHAARRSVLRPHGFGRLREGLSATGTFVSEFAYRSIIRADR